MSVGAGLPSKESLAQTGCQGWQAPGAGEYRAVAGLGFNSVRLAVSWANLEPVPPATVGGRIVHRYNQPYLQVLDNIIRSYGEVGVAVVLDMQQYKWSPAFKDITTKRGTHCQGSGMPTWLYPNALSESYLQAKCDFWADRAEFGSPLTSPQSGFVDLWRFLAHRYASDDTVVAADVLNEPYAVGPCKDPSTLNLNAFYERVGAAIRSVNPDIVLIFEDSQYNPSGRYALTGPPTFANKVYSFHLYTPNWEPLGKAMARVYLARAKRFDMPIWIGEFNRFGQPDAAPPDWPEQLQEMLRFCKSNEIGWNYWAYRGVDPLVDPGTDTPRVPLVPTLQSGI
jgi:endoglycosylceramidase